MAVAERPQLTVRRARLGDFEAVMAIHDFVYDGADYLKSMYHILLQHPDCHAYVGEVDGRVVTFTNQMVVFDGQAFMSGSGRTDPEYAGYGLVGVLINKVRAMLRPSLPSVKYGVMLGVGNRFSDSVGRGERAGLHMIRKTHFVFYETTRSKLAALLESTASHMTPKVLTSDGAKDLFTTDEKVKELCPDGVFKCGTHWLPKLARIRSVLDSVKMHPTFYTQNDVTGSCQTLSFCACVRASRYELRHDIDYYHNEYSDVGVQTKTETFVSHIIAHIRHTVKLLKAGTPGALVLTFPIDLDVQLVKTFLRPYLGNNVRSEYFCSEYSYIIQHRLPPLSSL